MSSPIPNFEIWTQFLEPDLSVPNFTQILLKFEAILIANKLLD